MSASFVNHLSLYLCHERRSKKKMCILSLTLPHTIVKFLVLRIFSHPLRPNFFYYFKVFFANLFDTEYVAHCSVLQIFCLVNVILISLSISSAWLLPIQSGKVKFEHGLKLYSNQTSHSHQRLRDSPFHAFIIVRKAAFQHFSHRPFMLLTIEDINWVDCNTFLEIVTCQHLIPYSLLTKPGEYLGQKTTHFRNSQIVAFLPLFIFVSSKIILPGFFTTKITYMFYENLRWNLSKQQWAEIYASIVILFYK